MFVLDIIQKVWAGNVDTGYEWENVLTALEHHE